MAAQHALTLDTVIAVIGEPLSVGQRKWIGKLLQGAGFSKVTLGDRDDYRKMAA